MVAARVWAVLGLLCLAVMMVPAMALLDTPLVQLWWAGAWDAVTSSTPVVVSYPPGTLQWWMRQVLAFLVGAMCCWFPLFLSSRRRRQQTPPRKDLKRANSMAAHLTPPTLSRDSSATHSSMGQGSLRSSLDLESRIAAYRRQVSTTSTSTGSGGRVTSSRGNSTWDTAVSLEAAQSAAPKQPPYSQTPASHGRMLVLAADDHPMNQHVLKLLLGQNDKYLLEIVCSGTEVLQAVFDSPHLPDIILLDVVLPDAKGAEVVRARYSLTQLPIIAIAGRSGEASLLDALEAGSNDFYVKPLTQLELLARMDAQLRVQRSVQVEAESRVHYTLLSQVLPPHIISRLQEGHTCIAEQHSQVTMLFSDIVGFTELCAEWRTELIVEMLDALFSRFDELCDKHGVYKVETIGDAYMIVAGHQGEPDHAARMVNMAVDMLIMVEEMRFQALGPAAASTTGGVVRHGSRNDPGWDLRIRIGIHTGPACSGVVGKERPRYCFFGDTVHTAQRMESNGFPGCIHLSPSTHAALRVLGGCRYPLLDCGLRVLKDKGIMHTYVAEVGNYQAFLDALDRERAGLPMANKCRRGSMVALPGDRLPPSRLNSIPSGHA